MTHDPTFWLLARASGLTAYALLTLSVLAGLVLKSRPSAAPCSAAAVTDVHRFLALLGLGALGAARRRARARLDRPRSRSRRWSSPVSSPYRPVAVVGVRRRRADGRLVTVVLAAEADRHAASGAGCTGRPIRVLPSRPRTASLPAPTRPAWALGLYLGAVGAVAFATAWRALTVPRPYTERSPS